MIDAANIGIISEKRAQFSTLQNANSSIAWLRHLPLH